MHKYMDMSGVQPDKSTYSVRKTDGDISISKKSVKAAGGLDRMVQRIVGIWLEMPERYRLVGPTWFPEAHEFACALADTYNITLWQASQVVGVLSPQNPWDSEKAHGRGKDGNRLCATKVIHAWAMHGESEVLRLRGWGYAPAFVRKCIRVLLGEELDWKGAPKTHRMSLLVWNPEIEGVVLVDSHSSRVALGNLGNRYHVVTVAAYPLIELAYLKAGELLGVPARHVQAGTWAFAAEGNLY